MLYPHLTMEDVPMSQPFEIDDFPATVPYYSPTSQPSPSPSTRRRLFVHPDTTRSSVSPTSHIIKKQHRRLMAALREGEESPSSPSLSPIPSPKLCLFEGGAEEVPNSSPPSFVLEIIAEIEQMQEDLDYAKATFQWNHENATSVLEEHFKEEHRPVPVYIAALLEKVVK
jgi:hypothetical protein